MGGIRLTTPKDAGDLDPNDYTDVRVTHVNWSLRDDRIGVTYQLGQFDDVTGEFTPGIVAPQLFIVQDGVNQAGEPDETVDDYTVLFGETFKTGTDTNAERFLEMVTNLISSRLGLAGTTVKPGRSGKKKL